MKKKNKEQLIALLKIKDRLKANLEFERSLSMSPEQRIKEQIKMIDEQISNLK